MRFRLGFRKRTFRRGVVPGIHVAGGGPIAEGRVRICGRLKQTSIDPARHHAVPIAD
jgi:hypothetical protein